ncbi:MAG TPA: hypothetical protein VN048_05420 [Verrucomicrobiae bacterium]|jgi:hypothetical protein|nr:hypothetical protein [Verrucomicrobiae bacterium]
MATRIEKFLDKEVQDYLIADIERLLELRPDHNGLKGCTIPTAMFLFATVELFGFLVAAPPVQIRDTAGNIEACFSHPISGFPTEYTKRSKTLVRLCRHGLMHQIFPKALGIRKVPTRNTDYLPLFESIDGCEQLNVDRFGNDVLSMLKNFTAKIAVPRWENLNKQMSERLDQISESDLRERRK